MLRISLLLGAAIIANAAPRTALAQDQAKIKSGAETYATYCSTCHGDDLVNTGPTTFDLRKLKADERPRFENSVTNGKKQMPPWKGVLNGEQLDGLWSYIRANAYEK